MKVILSKRIVRKEFGAKPDPNDLLIIKKGHEKGVFTIIKGDFLPKGTNVIKIYITTTSGARRIVSLVDMKSGNAFFLFMRTKNDPIGENISIKNPEFRKKLKEYISIFLEDFKNGGYDVMEC